jgi:exopolysaccharide biosynthesis polyprenyl glycosylphosphotransferase
MLFACLLEWKLGGAIRFSLPRTLFFSVMVGVSLAAVLSLDRPQHAHLAQIVHYTSATVQMCLRIFLFLLPIGIFFHSNFPWLAAVLGLVLIPPALALVRRAFTSRQGSRTTQDKAPGCVIVCGSHNDFRRKFYSRLFTMYSSHKSVIFIDQKTAKAKDRSPLRSVGSTRDLDFSTSALLRSLRCDLLIAEPTAASKDHDDLILAAQKLGIPVAHLQDSLWTDLPSNPSTDLNDVLSEESDTMSAPMTASWCYVFCKRMFDLVISSISLLLLAPIFLVIATLIRLSSRGPSLFVQERVGVRGTVFRMYKFRSMSYSAGKYDYSPTRSDDPRITRIGRLLRRTSLDELPQLLNVFLGDMSLVGPRPEMPFIVNRYSHYHSLRLQVTPGLTGLWQISRDRAYPIHQNLHHDLAYIRERSFSLDIAILIHTLLFAMPGGI